MHLLEHDAERLGLGRRAKETILSQMGATSRTVDALKALLGQNVDRQSQHAAPIS
jgi:hypothetical protein